MPTSRLNEVRVFVLDRVADQPLDVQTTHDDVTLL